MIQAEATPLGSQIEHRVIIGIRLAHGPEERLQLSLSGNTKTIQRSGGQWDEATEIPADRREIKDAPIRRRQAWPIAGYDQNVRIGRQIELVRAEVLMNAGKHAEHHGIVQLVHLKPLAENPIIREVAPDPGIELGGEQSRDTADPGIRWLRDDQVILSLRRGEVG